MKRGTFKEKTYDEKLASLKEKQAKATLSRKPKKKPAKRNSKPKKRKEKTQAQLKKELDRVFSIYIRTIQSDENGENTCYTCGKAGTIKTMQCGHFVSRQYLATRWNVDNCRIQCAGCNLFGLSLIHI